MTIKTKALTLKAAGRPFGASLLVCVAALAVGPWSPWSEALQFERAAIARGETWRLFTGHLTHGSWDQLLWEVGAFALLAPLCMRQNPWKFYVCLAASAPVVSFAIWAGRPELETYRGLSGIDSALFTMLSLQLLQASLRERRWFHFHARAAILFFFAAKLAYESLTGGTVFVRGGAEPVALAHVAGAAVGAVVALAVRPEFLRRLRRSEEGSGPRGREAPFGCAPDPALAIPPVENG